MELNIKDVNERLLFTVVASLIDTVAHLKNIVSDKLRETFDDGSEDYSDFEDKDTDNFDLFFDGHGTHRRKLDMKKTLSGYSRVGLRDGSTIHYITKFRPTRKGLFLFHINLSKYIVSLVVKCN